MTPFLEHIQQTLTDIEREGLLKRERLIARLERQTGLVQAVSECGVEECALREAARRHFSELDAEGN